MAVLLGRKFLGSVAGAGLLLQVGKCGCVWVESELPPPGWEKGERVLLCGRPEVEWMGAFCLGR